MGVIEDFSDYFTVQVASDKMVATLLLKKEYHLELSCSKADLIETLNAYHITWGFREDSLEIIVSGAQEDQFPIVVAEGMPPQHGTDGEIQYEKELDRTFTYDEKVNFRDVIKIPSVHAGDSLLTVLNPTNGISGRNVSGEEIPPKPGRSVLLRPGQNVEWKKRKRECKSWSRH